MVRSKGVARAIRGPAGRAADRRAHATHATGQERAAAIEFLSRGSRLAVTLRAGRRLRVPVRPSRPDTRLARRVYRPRNSTDWLLRCRLTDAHTVASYRGTRPHRIPTVYRRRSRRPRPRSRLIRTCTTRADCPPSARTAVVRRPNTRESPNLEHALPRVYIRFERFFRV